MSKEGAKAFFKRFVFVFLVVFLILIVLLSISSFIVGNFGVNLGLENAQGWKGIFEKVRILFAPGDLTASLVASRTSCVAPCAVFFDATGTTDVTTTKPFHEVDYTWGFGDPTSGNWATDGRSRNTATWPMAAHVFEIPGTYVVTLNAKDLAGNTDTEQVTININAFAGTTYYVSSTGSNSNAGTNPALPLQTFDAGMAKITASNVRVLFKRTESFSTSSGKTLDVSGPGIIGAYFNSDGTDDPTRAKPIVSFTGSSTNPVFGFVPGNPDWRVMDLDLRGAGASVSGGFAFSGGGGSPQTRSLVLRVNARDFRSAYFVGWNSVDHDENFIFDSNFTNLGSNVGPGGSNAVYFGGKRSAVMGTSVAGVTGSAEHILRIWHTRRMVISDNILMDPAGTKHVIKLHNERELYGLVSTSPPFPPNGQFVIISNNIFRSSDNSIINVGPQNNDVGIDEFIRDVIIERNSFLARTTSQDTTRDIQIRAYNVTVRNNVFNGQGAFGDYAAVHVFTGANQPGASIGTSVYDNSIYHGGSITQFAGIQVVGGSQLTIVRNNIAYAPSGVIKTVLDNGASGTVSSNNVLASSNAFVSPPNNLRLLTGNSAINTGASVPVFDDYDLKSRPIGSGWGIGAFENGTVAPIVSLINASLSASRTSCVAPCAAFFDATATNASTTSRPFHELDYSWDFGDSSSGVWTLSGKNKNSAKGPMGAHVFETPGIYTITLNVKDLAGNTASKQVSVTITDPNVAFTEANTFCFAKDNLNWAGCPTTITANRIVSNDASLVNDLNSRFAANRRLVLRRGDSWTINSVIHIDAVGPGILGAFGLGNKPKLVSSVMSDPNYVGLVNINGDDWRVMDLFLFGPSYSPDANGLAAISISAAQSNDLVLRNDITKFSFVGIANDWSFDSDDLAWVENYIYDIGQGGAYIGGNRIALIGNWIQNISLSHVMRVWYIDKGVIEHNTLHDPSVVSGGARHALKLHNDRCLITSGPNCISTVPSQRVVVSDNDFRGSGWVVALGPQDGGPPGENVWEIVFERNILRPDIGDANLTGVLLSIAAPDITVRNNIFIAAGTKYLGSGTGGAVHIWQDGPSPQPDRVNVYNNVLYKGDNGLELVFADVNSGANIQIRNNLAVLTNAYLGGEHQFLFNNVPVTASNNLFYSPNSPASCLNPSGGSTCLNPLFVNAGTENFRLQSGSPAINTGFATSTFFDDYDGNSRPVGAYDLGAFEFGSSPPASAINAQINASRLSCVAPCAVFFDATATNASTTSRPFHDLYYTWNFGDSASGNWATDGRSKNVAEGGVAAHVFETPGVYSVSLNVKDMQGNTDTEQVTINVNAFTGTTYYVSSTGSDGNAGTLTTAPLRTFDFAKTKIAPNVRILFKRTESFTSSSDTTLGTAGPGIIGAYFNADGSDDKTRAKPIINTAISGFSFSSSGP